MSDKARELLERSADLLEWQECFSLAQEIRAHLAAEEEKVPELDFSLCDGFYKGLPMMDREKFDSLWRRSWRGFAGTSQQHGLVFAQFIWDEAQREKNK